MDLTREVRQTLHPLGEGSLLTDLKQLTSTKATKGSGGPVKPYLFVYRDLVLLKGPCSTVLLGHD